MSTSFAQQPQGSQNPEAHMEQEMADRRIRQHVETKSMVGGDYEHVVHASTGETMDIDPIRFSSADQIYDKIRHNFALKDQAGRRDALAELANEMQLEHAPSLANETLEAMDAVDTGLTQVANNEEMDQDPKAAMEAHVNKLIKQLAEDIFDALQKANKSIEIIKPESIGSKTVSHLSEPGDANFIVANAEGDALFESLKAQEAEFRTVRKNHYGFVLENDTLGFKAVFVYQERLDHEGIPLKPEPETIESSNPEDIDNQPNVKPAGQTSNNVPRQ